ncbi:MAG: multidrug effflux MFS transporter [Rhodobacteraceae bacterium]|nr:multidrug effflux MFS transporter [Paracoccaceae bacterium]NNK67537.1 multidrug effflux MFS transporter [Paracoccaceae bacterium]
MTSHPAVRFLDRSTPPHIATLILLAGLSALSLNIFLPSLPGMTEYFDTDYRLMQLSVAVYLAMNAVLQLFIGPISDRYGRRPVILWSCGLFLLATLGCIIATTAEMFLVFRMAQAVIVTGMVLSRAVVRDMFPQEQAASMIGYVTMGMSIVPMVGPAFGGVLDQWFGWKANFWALFALGVALLWLIWRDLGETAAKENQSFAAQFREYPELFTSRRFWGYCIAAASTSGAFFAYLGGAPFVGTEVFGMDPATLGFFFGAPAVGYLVGNGISGRYSVRIGINSMILWGSILSAGGLLMSLVLNYAGLKTPLSFFGFMVFVGLGNGLVLPNANAGMLSVRPHLAGTAAGVGGAIMIGGGAALSAFAGAMLTPGSGAAPLIVIMLMSGLIGVLAISYVIRREREITVS